MTELTDFPVDDETLDLIEASLTIPDAEGRAGPTQETE